MQQVKGRTVFTFVEVLTHMGAQQTDASLSEIEFQFDYRWSMQLTYSAQREEVFLKYMEVKV